MMKAGAVGRLDNVTKLLKTAKRQSVQWRMQDFVNREAFHPLFEEPTGSEIRGYQPGKFFILAESQSPSKNCRKIATRRLITQSNNFGVSRKRFKPPTPGSSPNSR